MLTAHPDSPLAPLPLAEGVASDDYDRVREAYGPNYERLVELKRRYDPGNLFRLNHNIYPEV